MVSFGSFLFGFNTAVISGALLYITDEFHLNFFQEGLLVSILILGAVFGAFIGGILADKFGRRLTLFFVSILFLLGTTLVIGKIFLFFLFGRFIQGIGVGIVSSVVPLYISEISPIKYRGALVSLNQLAIVLGVCISYLVDYFLLDWRMMLGFAYIPSLFLFLGLFFIKETSAFLEKKKKKFLDKKEVFFKKENKKALFVGIGISVIQQITGINVVIYYAPKIFKLVKSFDHSQAIFIAVILGIVQFVMTIFSLFLIDRVGRRKLLLFGSLGMAISMFFLGFAIELGIGANIIILSLISYISFFAISLGPIAWLLIAEIFPLSIRGRAVGIAALSNWGANYLVSFSFLPLMGLLGAGKTFFLFSLISVFSFYFIKKRVPETKNRSFEDIQEFWKK
ncbi:MAG: hypothetical protein AMS24_04270 [Chlamydiae bacterium SM23_39]|nr:MAG: hypothetical protein AMS24_04270 [Chlamydiae bacterium SM23_39]